jgi:hypothetical protein
MWILLEWLPPCLRQHRKPILSFTAVICHPFFLYTDRSIAAVICHPVFPSTEFLSCPCLPWFAVLSSPVLNCCPVFACRDLPSCLSLYWIAVLSMHAVICHPVLPCIQNPSCKSPQWFSILSSPHWIVYHWLSIPATICHPFLSYSFLVPCTCLSVYPVQRAMFLVCFFVRNIPPE